MEKNKKIAIIAVAIIVVLLILAECQAESSLRDKDAREPVNETVETSGGTEAVTDEAETYDTGDPAGGDETSDPADVTESDPAPEQDAGTESDAADVSAE